MIEKRQFYINGQWVDPIEGKDHHVIDPSTEEPCAVISLGGAKDVDAAVAAAKAALPGWMATPPAERIALVEKLIEIYQARSEDIAQATSIEMGAPIDFSRTQQVGAGTWHLTNFVKAAKNFKFIKPLGDHAPDNRIVYEAVGVCALITPWNWPMNQVTLKVIPALATGCTCVLKPSEHTPISGAIYAEIVHAAGYPAGVFNLVQGDGPTVGAAMSRHKDIQMMSFTGSTRAGIAVTKDAADTVKRVTLELGGKSPNLVFADCDLQDRVEASVLECMYNTGQSCDAPTRLLVERSCYDAVLDIAKATAEAQTVGDPSQDGDHIGPLFDKIQFDRVQTMIQKGIDEGANLLAGGTGRPDGHDKGWFVKPTIFADVTNDMAIAQQEIFGPVLVIIPFEDEADAIRIANDTPYGLAAYLQTGDPERAERVAGQLRAGAVHINGGGFNYGSPFGGYKQSGNGREGGMHGLEDYQETKTLHFG